MIFDALHDRGRDRSLGETIRANARAHALQAQRQFDALTTRLTLLQAQHRASEHFTGRVERLYAHGIVLVLVLAAVLVVRRLRLRLGLGPSSERIAHLTARHRAAQSIRKTHHQPSSRYLGDDAQNFHPRSQRLVLERLDKFRPSDRCARARPPGRARDRRERIIIVTIIVTTPRCPSSTLFPSTIPRVRLVIIVPRAAAAAARKRIVLVPASRERVLVDIVATDRATVVVVVVDGSRATRARPHRAVKCVPRDAVSSGRSNHVSSRVESSRVARRRGEKSSVELSVKKERIYERCRRRVSERADARRRRRGAFDRRWNR